MSRKERLQLQAEQAMQAVQSIQQEQEAPDRVEEPSEPAFDVQAMRRELEEARAEKARLAAERDEIMRERDSYGSTLRDRETAAEQAAREAAEYRAELDRIREERELALSDEDFEGLDPEFIPKFKHIVEKQSRAIAKMEAKRLKEELESSLLSRAKTEVLTEVESRNSRATFDAKLRADGDDDVYDIIANDDFKDFVKADELRLSAFTNAANTKDDTSARVIKRLVKDFKEKAVKKPVQTPRTTANRGEAVYAESSGDVAQVNHAQIMKMIKSHDPAERKRGKELLDKAAETMAKNLSSPRMSAYS